MAVYAGRNERKRETSGKSWIDRKGKKKRAVKLDSIWA